MTTALWTLAVLAALLGGGRWALHRGFRAPRVTGAGGPADVGLAGEEVAVATAGGKRLFGWFIPAAGPGPHPAVAMMHGWGANAELLLPLAVPLHRAGYGVLLLDARNHGRSDPDSFSSMPRFAEDLEAGLDRLLARHDVDPARIALLGHSVGAAAALLVASRRTEPAAVVSIAAFDHPERVMRLWLTRMRVPYRPLGWLVCRYVERVIGHRFDAIAPVATVRAVRCPVLVVHGALDDTVAPDAARAIHAAGAAGSVELAILPDTGHDRAPCVDTLGRDIAVFLDRATGHGVSAAAQQRVGERP
ncbi:alpha/beta hydrolase [Azospirillum halopraeferens]|uniref:alpha/beta hydrolase n=1 Tax=Azospirillum halopraeferens TaxID=34010 RepID=UPI0004126AC2|nr:alpha/beta fold hydrolase [Azospirillum halopraeferens]